VGHVPFTLARSEEACDGERREGVYRSDGRDPAAGGKGPHDETQWVDPVAGLLAPGEGLLSVSAALDHPSAIEMNGEDAPDDCGGDTEDDDSHLVPLHTGNLEEPPALFVCEMHERDIDTTRSSRFMWRRA
jgi:hypothetical protein